MRVHFLLGPAGSGKTWRCLDEIRRELAAAPGGPPLVLLAPKQATFQLERQLLEQPGLAGYSRLQIVPFDRLAHWLLETFATVPELLDDEGRVMVLRALLAREQPALRVFRATARLPGFARQLSQLLREFQRHQLTPARLARLAERVTGGGPLRDKLHDLHHLLSAYHAWLTENGIEDGDQLLDLATAFLRDEEGGLTASVVQGAWCGQESAPAPRNPHHPISCLWLDGFAEMTPQELDLLCAVLPFCRRATLAFCLDEPAATSAQSWLSLWSVVRRTYIACRQRVQALSGGEVTVEELARDPAHSRFAASPELAALEADWSGPAAVSSFPISPALRLVVCPSPEAEAVFAAREILRQVQAGGRFRDCAVILRTLDHHHAALRRTFTRYGIPFFLDRREPVAHHPLAELTRFALRTLAYGWQPEDLFGALKSGLVHPRDEDVDWLENLALAHGWRGAQWLAPLSVPDPKFNLARAEQLRAQLTAPLRRLADALTKRAVLAPPDPLLRSEEESPLPATEPVPADSQFAIRNSQFSGSALAAALRDFWEALGIEPRLEAWDDALARESASPQLAPALHGTVLRQMRAWLENLERAFPDATDGNCKSSALPLREWLPILEAGLGALTVGVIPPALDQVLVGTVDRSRNPELKLAVVLGLNEGIFPAPPAAPVLLTDAERDLLAVLDLRLGPDPRSQIAHERYLAYIACTRSRGRLVLACAAASADGKPLHPSPIIAHIQRLFPHLKLEPIPATQDWRGADHAEDLLEPILRELALARDEAAAASRIAQLAIHPAISPVVARWRDIVAARADVSLPPTAVTQLYGAELRTSVSKLEQFAECPFKFFVAAGLGAEERKEFQVDHRERGTFIHRLLDEFHLRLAADGRRWRDLAPADAAALAARVGEDLLGSPEFARFAADEARRFAARTLIDSAQRLLAALAGWMPGYAFDPVAVELGFGLPGSPLPGWRLELGGARSLLLRGRIDRVDLCRDGASAEAFAVIVDYKSSPKKLDALKIAHGLQLQLLAYLRVLCQRRDELQPWAGNPLSADLSAALRDLPLRPAGVFYVALHGAAGATGGRGEILGEDEAGRRTTYQHSGRFDLAQLPRLDRRPGGQASGQFRYALNKDGSLSRRGGDALPSAEFAGLLAQVEASLRQLGEAIFAGDVRVAPVRLSASEKACDRCDYRAICRFDPWIQPYRTLAKPAVQEEEA